MDEPRTVLLLALADDELVIGHRHSLWTGVAPHLEEDLAFSSIAQDEVGHAVIWYGLMAELTGEDPDALALGRAPDQYRHATLCERDNGDWAQTIARQLLYDLAEDVRLATLAGSTWPALAAATGAPRREERYHLLHARAWLQRLAAGPPEARERLRAALAEALPIAAGLFEPLPGEDALLAEGVLPRPHTAQLADWLDQVAADLRPFGLDDLVDRAVRPASPGGRQGHHGPEWPGLWDEMTALYRSEPGARW
jgi:ring-1,2-phenylacetyl-CoA epoxidase subunit PaaC